MIGKVTVGEYVEIIKFFSDPDNEMMALISDQDGGIHTTSAPHVKLITLSELNKG